MDEAPENRTTMSAGRWLGLGCGVMLAALATLVIVLVAARRPRESQPVAVTVAPPPTTELLTAVEAQPDRDPFARDGGAPVDETSDEGGAVAEDGEAGGDTPPQPVVPMPGPAMDEPPVDEPPPDIPEPSVGRGRGNRGARDEDGGDEGSGESETAPVAKPAKPKMPTAAELKPHDPKEPPAWAAPPQAAEGGLELVAVIAGRQPQAVFRKEGAYHRVRLGDTIDGLKIERIDTTGVYLKDGEHRFLIRMPAKITPGGQRGSAPSAPRTMPTPEPETEMAPETPTRPTPELAPLPAPTPSTPPAGRGGTTGERPGGGQRPGGWQRPGGGQFPSGGQGGGTFGGGCGRRRPPTDEGDGDQ